MIHLSNHIEVLAQFPISLHKPNFNIFVVVFISFHVKDNEPAHLMFGSNGLPYFSLNVLLARLNVLLERNHAVLASIALFMFEVCLKPRPPCLFG